MITSASHDPEIMVHSILHKQSEVVSVTVARFDQLKLSEIYVCSLAITGFGCSAIIADLSSSDSPSDPLKVQTLEISCTLSTLLLLFSIYLRTKQELLWEQAKGIYSYLDDIYTTGKMNSFLLEALVNLVHVPIGLGSYSFTATDDLGEELNYSYAGIISFFMTVRVYHVLRLVSVISTYRSSRSQRLCQMNGIYAGTSYAIKCMMKDSPVVFMTWMLLIGIFGFGYQLRIAERHSTAINTKNFADYGNSMWCIITTMTTVGYGDYAPKTMVGRMVGAVASIWGVVVISLICVSLYNLLRLDLAESNSLITLHRLWFKSEIRNASAFLITSICRYKVMRKTQSEQTVELEMQLGKVRNYLNEYERCKNKQRILYDFDSYNEIIEYKLENIVDMTTCEKKQKEIGGLLERLEEKIKKKNWNKNKNKSNVNK